MTIHDEVYARYQEVHESHVNPAGRDVWMREYARLNVVPHFPPGTRGVLEIACGAGDLLDVLRERDERYYVAGTDLCPANVERAISRGHFVYQRNVFERPLLERFDAIVAMGLIEHLPKDELLPALRTCASMLRPGGTVQFHTQNMDAAIGVHYRYLDITHELGFTHESLAQVGRLVFPRVHIAPMVYPPEALTTWKSWLFDGVLSRVWRRLYRYHLRLMKSPVVDSWYDVVGLVGVFGTAPDPYFTHKVTR